MLKINSIEWHNVNIKNNAEYNYRREKEITEQIKKLNESNINLIFYRKQVKEAIKQNKTEFCADRFLKRKRRELCTNQFLKRKRRELCQN